MELSTPLIHPPTHINMSFRYLTPLTLPLLLKHFLLMLTFKCPFLRSIPSASPSTTTLCKMELSTKWPPPSTSSQKMSTLLLIAISKQAPTGEMSTYHLSTTSTAFLQAYNFYQGRIPSQLDFQHWAVVSTISISQSQETETTIQVFLLSPSARTRTTSLLSQFLKHLSTCQLPKSTPTIQ